MTASPTHAEKRLLHALAWMCEQYLEKGGRLDDLFMSAGEDALDALAEYGRVDLDGPGGVWTEAGQKLLDEDL